MASLYDRRQKANRPDNQTPPIDLNALHTPHKLAAFVVNVPSRKAEFAFLFNEDQKTNTDTSNASQQFLTHNLNAKNTQFLNLRSSSSLKPPSMMKKHKSKSKKRHKKKLKMTHTAHKHLNKDEEDMEEDIYNAEIDDTVGPRIDRKPTIENDLPNSPLAKSNVFNETGTKPSIGYPNTTPPPNKNDESTETRTAAHHEANESTSTIASEPAGSMPIPEPGDINAIGDFPRPFEPVMPSQFDPPSLKVISTDAFKYSVSLIETPTLETDMPSISNLSRVSIDPTIDQLSDGDHTPTQTVNDEETKEDVSSETESEETEEDSDDEEAYAYLEEEEENICMRIGKVLYENSWTGDMISSSREFSRREYNALLDVGNIPSDSYISNLVWKIIFYSQKKSKDDLINEDKEHIKWYWFDSNDMDSDWKWRKYNVVICEWITQQFDAYLKETKNESKEIDFKDCEQNLIDLHKEKKSKKHIQDEKDKEEKKKNTKPTIDPYFGKSNYDHFLLIERQKENILLWHKITKSNKTYYRELRLDHKLLAIKPDMIIANYQPNPSPFAIPPQLAVDA
eukprot:575001_1